VLATAYRSGYFLMRFGCSLGLKNCLPSLAMSHGSPVALRSFSKLSSFDALRISRLTRRSRLAATRLSLFSLEAQVIPAIGVDLRDRDMMGDFTQVLVRGHAVDERGSISQGSGRKLEACGYKGGHGYLGDLLCETECQGSRSQAARIPCSIPSISVAGRAPIRSAILERSSVVI
jgi:hypothetical protein